MQSTTTRNTRFLPVLALLLAGLGGVQSAQAATPALVRATSWFPFTTVRVEFSEPIDPESGSNAANYALQTSDGTSVPITGAAFGTTEFSAGVVMLGTTLAPGKIYTLKVNNISDLSAPPNTLASGQLNFTLMDIRVEAINNSQPFEAEPVGDKIYVEGGGRDIWNLADQFAYAYMWVYGDFDFKLRVESWDTPSGAQSQRVGLMVRESTAAGSRHILQSVQQEGVAFVPYYRATTDGVSTSGWGIRKPAPLPDAWVRLKRTGAVVYQYWATEGTNWTLQQTLDTSNTSVWSEGPLSPAVMVGIATLSHDNGTTVKAVTSEFGPLDGVLPPITPVAIATQPADFTVTELTSATFTVEASGTPPYAYQWYKNGAPATDATNSKYILAQVPYADNGAAFSVVVTNFYGSVTSSVAHLTVQKDLSAVSLVQASSWYPFTNVIVQFSRLIDAESASNVTHYTLRSLGGISVPINDAAFGTNFGATEDSNGLVILGVGENLLIPGTNYTLTVSNIKDRAAVPHTLATAQAGFTPVDIRSEAINNNQVSSAIAVGDKIYLEAGGQDIWGIADRFGYTYIPIAGDFDFRLRIESMVTLSGAQSQRAGLMVRESTDSGSRHIYSCVSAEGNNFVPFYRSASFSASTDGWGVAKPAPLPNAWVRLQRVGPVVYQYWGTNGAAWTLQRTVDTSGWSEGPLLDQVLIGIGTLSHDSGVTVKAIVSGFGSLPAQLSIARAGTDLTISWTGPGKLESASQLDGLWNEVSGATNPLTVTPSEGSKFYRVRQ